eukprot:jgi/Astpho2/1718/Aster-04143
MAARLKVLAVTAGQETEGLAEGRLGPLQEIYDLAGSEVEIVLLQQRPSAASLREAVQAHNATLLYLTSNAGPETSQEVVKPLMLSMQGNAGLTEALTAEMAASLVQGLSSVQVVFLMGSCPAVVADALRAAGVPHVIHWQPKEAMPIIQASHFGHAFLSMLRNPGASVGEAFAVAVHACHAHCSGSSLHEPVAPLLPRYVADQPAALPASSSVPLPTVEGLDFSHGISAVVPGWDDVRLLAPHAEMRLLCSGQSCLIDAHRLSYLGEALRALLVLEMRGLTVHNQQATERVPAHLPQGCTAVRCNVRSASGGHATVVLGGPPDVSASEPLVEHALRQTLVADALSLQFKLPPPGEPAPAARSSAAVAGGSPVVDAVAVTSVWAVHLLRTLCQDSSFRGLVALGIAAVGSTSTSAFGATDAERFTGLTTTSAQLGANGVAVTTLANGAMDGHHALRPPHSAAPSGPASVSTGEAPRRPAQPSQFSNPLAGQAGVPRPLPDVGPPEELQADGAAAASRKREREEEPLPPSRGAKQPRINVMGQVEEADLWQSERPELSSCSDADLVEDIRRFLEKSRCRELPPESFPGAVVNSMQLDLASLYREVFPRLKNYTAGHKMTGVGNALKRHYQQWLSEYEEANPQDVSGSPVE